MSVQTAYPDGELQDEEQTGKIVEEIEGLFEGILGDLPKGTSSEESVGKLCKLVKITSGIIAKRDSIKKVVLWMLHLKKVDCWKSLILS